MPTAPQSREFLAQRALPTIAVMGFGVPVCRGQELVLPVHVHGDLHRLHGARKLWKKTALDILRLVGPELLAENLPLDASPAELVHFESALAAIREGKSADEAAGANGISVSRFKHWLDTQTTAAVVAQRVPYEKPSGGIL